jgi:hypothetical protein
MLATMAVATGEVDRIIALHIECTSSHFLRTESQYIDTSKIKLFAHKHDTAK